MAVVTVAQKSALQSVYTAYFNRPAEPDGYKFYISNISKNLDLGLDFKVILDNIAKNFAKSPEAQTDYPFLASPTTESPASFLLAVYQNAFNRTEPPTSEGFKFWLARLTDPTNPLEPGLALLKIMEGAKPGSADRKILDNKTEVAQKYTTDAEAAGASFVYGDAAKAAAKALLGAVDGTAASVAKAIADADGLINGTGSSNEKVGVTINLSSATNVVSPNNADPAFKSTADADTINAPAGTFTSATNINGDGSTDTIFATRTIGGTITPTLSNVEKLFVTAQSGGTIVDLTNATGLTEVWSKDTNFAAGATFVDFHNIKAGTNIGVQGTGDNIFLFDALPAGANKTKLFVKQATNNKIGIDSDIDELDVEIEGASSLEFTFSSAFKTMTVGGTGNLTLDAMPNTIQVFDASALNGSVIANDMSSTDGVKVTGTRQADEFMFSINNAMDTIVYNSTNVSTTSARDTYTNFNSGSAASFEDKIDVSAFALTGGKSTITTFSSAPTEGVSFNGNAVAKLPNDTVYVDSNNNGVFDGASDLAFDIIGAATATLDVSDFIF